MNSGTIAGTQVRQLVLLAACVTAAFCFARPAYASADAQPAIVPVHGTLLASGRHGAVIETDAATGEFPAATRRYAVAVPDGARLPAGTGLDGFVDRSHAPWRWLDPRINGAFVPGMPQRGLATPVDIGSRLFTDPMVDQQGRLTSLRAFKGKVVLLSFIFTRCPDASLCPAISGKFAYLQHQLDPKYFHLVEITLDPVYDSPAILQRYAQQYGADPRRWSLLTSEPYTIQHLLNAYGINSLRVSTSDFIHNDKLFIYDRTGRVAEIIQTAAWSPLDVAAEARHISGMTSNPFGRLRLSFVAAIIAFCGGSSYTGIIVMDSLILLGSMAVVAVLLFLLARYMWKAT